LLFFPAPKTKDLALKILKKKPHLSQMRPVAVDVGCYVCGNVHPFPPDDRDAQKQGRIMRSIYTGVYRMSSDLQVLLEEDLIEQEDQVFDSCPTNTKGNCKKQLPSCPLLSIIAVPLMLAYNLNPTLIKVKVYLSSS